MFDSLQPVCGFCQLPGNHPVLGPLLGPIGGTEYYVHRSCAIWSPEVHESEEGTLLRVLEAVRRGRQLRCSGCGRRGASLGCRVAKCRETFHALCAHQSGCTMFLNHNIACKTHARRYQRDPVHPAPFGAPLAVAGVGGLPAATPARGGRPGDGIGAELGIEETPLPGVTPAAAAALASPLAVDMGDGAPSPKRRRMEEAMVRRERAAEVMKRVWAQQRRAAAAAVAAAATGEGASDDEEHFARREAARLQRDIAKLNPITLGAHKGACNAGPVATQSVFLKAPKSAPKTSAPRVQPAEITAAAAAVAETGFADLAGAESVVRQLRESVLLPLVYPEVFSRLKVTPPRGILFHGPPGTGKTLAARALAGECAIVAPTPITFFSRKGCDCLGKFVGDAERTLRLMFEEASRRAPSIIFIDEIEALVPARRGGAGGGGGASAAGGGAQDQIHASVVSTLLALMDGMADRGNVVVLAATNRPDSVDAALRRPGRFDREVFFGLPTVRQRDAILRTHTRKWTPAPPSAALLASLAAATEGFAGADLAALCAAAVTAAARRAAPLLVERAEAAAQSSGNGDGSAAAPPPPLPEIAVEERDWEVALTAAPPPCSKRDASHALATDCARPLAHPAVPLLLPPLRQALAALGRTEAPLPEAVSSAAAVAIAAEAATPAEAAAASYEEQERPDSGGASGALEAALVGLGAVQSGPTGMHMVENGSLYVSMELSAVAEPGNAAGGPRPAPGDSYPALRLLLAGSGEAGQAEVSGAVLRLFGGSHVAVLSLPAMAAEGAGDAASGAVALAREALARASPRSALVLYLPRLETWAVAPDEEDEGEEGGAAEMAAGAKGGAQGGAWMLSGGVPGSPPPFGGVPTMAVRSAAGAAAEHSQAPRRGGTAPPPLESDAWAALDSMLREAAPRQPIVVIATSEVPATQLPSAVLEGFERSCGVVTVDLDSQKGVKAEEALEQALYRAGEVARAAVASAGAAAFADWAVPSPRVFGDEGAADTRLETPAVAEGPPPASTPQPAEDPLAAVAQRAKDKAGLNASEWQRAQAMFAAVQGFLADTGTRLAADRRCSAAGAVALPLPPHPEDPVPEVSVRAVALDAARGRFFSLEAFQGALARAVAAIAAAAEEERKSGNELTWHPSSAAIAHAIEDEISVAVHAFRAGLELDDAGNARVLAAATAVAAEVAAAAQEAEDRDAEAAAAANEEARRLEAAAAEGEEEGGEGGSGDGMEAAQEEPPAATDASQPEIMDLEGQEAEKEALMPTPAPSQPATDTTAAAAAAELAARRSSAFSQAHSLLSKSGGWKEAGMDFVFNASLRGCPLCPAVAEVVPALVSRGAAACDAALEALGKEAGRSAGGAGNEAALGRLATTFAGAVARDLAKGLR